MLDLSIIIVTYNSEKYISKCIDSIIKYLNGVTYEIIVVDNNSSDSTSDILMKEPKVALIKNEKNYGFASANNQGIEAANGNYILILNPDIIITGNSRLSEIINYFEQNPSTGIVSLRLLYEDGKIQESARQFPSIFTFLIRGFKLEKYFQQSSFYKKNNVFNYINSTDPVEVDWVIGAFMFTKKEIIKNVGLFDRKFFMYYEDADLCSRIKQKGYKIIYYPYLNVIHLYRRESAKPIFSRLKLIHFKSFFRFFLKRNWNIS